MKMECMAQFLIRGDIILFRRKKYEVLDTTTFGDTVSIQYREVNAKKAEGSIVADKSEFIKIISRIPLEW